MANEEIAQSNIVRLGVSMNNPLTGEEVITKFNSSLKYKNKSNFENIRTRTRNLFNRLSNDTFNYVIIEEESKYGVDSQDFTLEPKTVYLTKGVTTEQKFEININVPAYVSIAMFIPKPVSGNLELTSIPYGYKSSKKFTFGVKATADYVPTEGSINGSQIQFWLNTKFNNERIAISISQSE